MNTFAVLLLCVQACLVQNVWGQCLRGAELVGPAYGGYLGGLGAPCGLGLGAYGLADGIYGSGIGAYGLADGNYGRGIGAYGLADGVYGLGLGCGAAYGGEGIGDVAVAGTLPVEGRTLVAGQVPIMGAVEFGGGVAAAGGVSIAGSCGCGCRGPYLY
ncbi:chorion class A protein Ld12-like isoform X7 [Maniola jurtina]|uniref:chorion class A protein Ld12-like isoform X7 n=1 Tax=Maniola jurtina TaxID=191418 RepID=UPI001E68B777|nr:chorion class A protein Ld12-like isoform X7 [Maniola jurtina]